MKPNLPRHFTSLLICTVLFYSVVMAQIDQDDPSKFYRKYAKYHPYCSTPSQMASRKIPPLEPNDSVGDSRLVHVTSIIRHGARTPWSGDSMTCWKGYWDEGADTAKWDCDLKTTLGTPKESPNYIFDKKYDPLKSPLHNELHGTCQQGQLLWQGYYQEQVNGEMLRDAYIFDSENDVGDNITMQLIDSKEIPLTEPTILFRSDDDQRTLMSGQILLSTMFGDQLVQSDDLENQVGGKVAIPLHVADRQMDVMDPAEHQCGRLTEIREEAHSSKEFKTLMSSHEAETLERFTQEQLGTGKDIVSLDCLMTTMCTDRALPAPLDDYGVPTADDIAQEYGSNVFERMATLSIQKATFHTLYNDGEYSKLGIAPMWSEILDYLIPIVKDKVPPENATKFALFSGHDTTIIPIMASLGPRVWNLSEWPHYASMVNIEVHQLVDNTTEKSVFASGFAFRLVYNGQVLTDRLDGCHEGYDLCDMDILLDRVMVFATRDRECDLLHPEIQALKTTSELVSTPVGVAVVVFVVVLSCCMGCVCTWIYSYWGRRGSKQHAALVTPGQDYHDEDDDKDDPSFEII